MDASELERRLVAISLGKSFIHSGPKDVVRQFNYIFSGRTNDPQAYLDQGREIDESMKLLSPTEAVVYDGNAQTLSYSSHSKDKESLWRRRYNPAAERGSIEGENSAERGLPWVRVAIL